MKKLLIVVCFAAFLPQALMAQPWRDLFNGKNLDGWQVRGDGVWYVLKEGVLVGQRKPSLRGIEWPLEQKQYLAWLYTQAWLYTVEEFGEFDLHLEYWLPEGGNSGVSIRDTSRAEHAIATPADFKRTPSRIGYEIQINNGYPDPTPTGSIYALAKAKTGPQIDNQWNAMDIESRAGMIRVRLNGELVAEHPGEPSRPAAGPIGLQLHDQYSLAMFRNIRIREVKK